LGCSYRIRGEFASYIWRRGNRRRPKSIVAIRNSKDEIATGVSSGLELRGELLEAVLCGTELDEILESNFGVRPGRDGNGFYGLATNDLVTRQAAYEQAITFALASYLHPEFYTG